MADVILDQTGAQKEKFLDLKLVQISSSVLIKASVHGKGSVCSWKQVRNNHRKCSILSDDQRRVSEVKSIKGLQWAATNTDELKKL